MSLRPILVAEDDDNDLTMLKMVFESCRVKNPLQVVNDGEEAIAYLAGEKPFDDRERFPLPILFLLDLVMRRKGGLQVLEWLQARSKPSFPIVIFTGMRDLSQMRVAYQMGAHSFLMKPLVKRDFELLINGFKEIEIEQ